MTGSMQSVTSNPEHDQCAPHSHVLAKKCPGSVALGLPTSDPVDLSRQSTKESPGIMEYSLRMCDMHKNGCDWGLDICILKGLPKGPEDYKILDQLTHTLLELLKAITFLAPARWFDERSHSPLASSIGGLPWHVVKNQIVIVLATKHCHCSIGTQSY